MSNTSISSLFEKNIETNQFSHAYIIHGLNGNTLETECLQIVSLYLNKYHPNIKPPTLHELNNPDIFSISQIESIKIDHIKQLQSHIQFAPYCISKSFIIINNSHNLTPQAANAFLKTLEEPPKNIIFFLLTTDIQSLLDTIKSRCISIYCPCESDKELPENCLSIAKFNQLSLIEKLNFSKTLCEQKTLIEQQCHIWLNELSVQNIPYTNSNYNHILNCLNNLQFNVNPRLQIDNLCLKINTL